MGNLVAGYFSPSRHALQCFGMDPAKQCGPFANVKERFKILGCLGLGCHGDETSITTLRLEPKGGRAAGRSPFGPFPKHDHACGIITFAREHLLALT